MNLTVNGREHEITSPPLTPLLQGAIVAGLLLGAMIGAAVPAP